MQQDTFGKLPSGKRLEKISSSPHYGKSAFLNLTETKMMADDASYFTIIRRMLKGDSSRQPPHRIPSVQTNFAALPDKPHITWFGHSTYLIQANGIGILMDPVFSHRASFAQYLGPSAFPGTEVYSLDELPSVDYVIISHDHYDHLDYNTIVKLKGQVRQFYVPLGVGSHLEHWGVPADRITELDWWENAAMSSDMLLTATPARHFSGRGFVRNKTLWASYVLKLGNYKLYLGGDSGYDQHFKEIGHKHGPFDLVILENGQYDANWPFIHMMPEQTVQASIDLGGKVLFPVHWGKFSLAAHPWNEPAIRVTTEAAKLNVNVTTPKIGEPIIIDSIYPSGKWWNF